MRFVISSLILLPFASVAQTDFRVGNDFAAFYQEFRSAVLADDANLVAGKVCFPLRAHEVGELVDKNHLVQRDTFIRLRLDKQLMDAPVWKYGPVINGKMTVVTPYESQRDFIVDTADIHRSEKLGPAFSKYVSSTQNDGRIFNLNFKRTRGAWCWSESMFDWDIPGLNVKP